MVFIFDLLKKGNELTYVNKNDGGMKLNHKIMFKNKTEITIINGCS